MPKPEYKLLKRASKSESPGLSRGFVMGLRLKARSLFGRKGLPAQAGADRERLGKNRGGDEKRA